ncbi:hypothetical protein CEXT_250791 [Caerostris extrusa]|uniref:Uncharacterized protein n=1 Tax=Caerostris extrusa TaxID=172846 RepID=A0AAV4TCB4_CAEEX|nr:hypothetical protein CEXT_250791 [Caerostris extrusa]
MIEVSIENCLPVCYSLDHAQPSMSWGVDTLSGFSSRERAESPLAIGKSFLISLRKFSGALSTFWPHRRPIFSGAKGFSHILRATGLTLTNTVCAKRAVF